MQIHLLETGTLITKGSDMFCGLGNVDWQQHYPAINANKAKWAMRSLLIQNDNMNLLIDTGPGLKLGNETLQEYGIEDTNALELSLNEFGISRNEITHVILTHLHFDHCGGNTIFNANGTIEATFPYATYYASKTQIAYALNPLETDKESYRRADFMPLLECNSLLAIEHHQDVFPFINFLEVNGHTPGQLVPIINNDEQSHVFAADLLPSAAHVPEQHIMAYDIAPDLSRIEKAQFLAIAAKENYRVYLQHDIRFGLVTISKTGSSYIYKVL